MANTTQILCQPEIKPSSNDRGGSLDLRFLFNHKVLLEQTDELKVSLKREYSLCANAMAFYRRAGHTGL